MSTFGEALNLLLMTFDKYAAMDGDSNTLTKTEVKQLLQSELGQQLEKATENAAIDDLFKQLDANRDNKVDFREFMVVVAALASELHDFLIGGQQAKGICQ